MNKDIKIDSESENFKLRVNGVLIVDNEVLTVKIDNNPFYCLPGGHIKMGEDSKEAIIREIKEETGIDVQVEKLLSVTENFFTRKNGKKIHELGFYYLLNPNEETKKQEREVIEEDEGNKTKLYLKWVDIDKMENIDFRPYQLKDKIKNKDESFKHILIK